MASKRKSRGVGNNNQMSVEERTRQWNLNMAERTLTNLFNEVGNVSNYKHKSTVYTPDSLYQKANEYFHDILQKNEDGIAIIPDIEDFCLFAQISRYTFLQYRRSDDPSMADVANKIANAIGNVKKSQALHGNINSTIFAIDFNNNHDYVQMRTELQLYATNTNAQIEASTEEILARIPEE